MILINRLLRKAREWRIPTQIGILAGFGKQTTTIPVLMEKISLIRERGHGVIFFYWEVEQDWLHVLR